MSKKKVSAKWAARKRGFLLGSLEIGGLAAARAAQGAQVPYGAELAPPEQQRLCINNGAEVSSLDPHKTDGSPAGRVMHNLLEGLVILNQQGQVAPGVAKRWYNPEPRTWMFHLRPDAHWSNGDRVTAHDFVYALRRLADPKTGSIRAAYVELLKLLNAKAVLAGSLPLEALGVTALDDYTLQLKLSEPMPYLVNMLVGRAFYPLHRATLERWGDEWATPAHYVGNGAYHLQEWVVNEKLVLSRSPTYWNNGHTTIEQVTYLPIVSALTDVSRYRAGEIDITNAISSDHFHQWQRERPQELYIAPAWGIYCLELNTAQPPFNNAQVRLALSMVLDRQALVNTITQRGETVAYTLNPPGMGGFYPPLPEWASWSQEKRNREAQRLLSAAGYGPHKPLQFTLLYNPSELNKQIVLAVSALWQQHIGAKVTLKSEEWATYLESLRISDFQIARSSWMADYNEPSALLNIYCSHNCRNATLYQSQAFDRRMAKALQVNSEAERFRCYQQAEAQLIQDAPVIPIYYQVNVRLVKPYVKGLSMRNPMGGAIYIKDLYIVKKKASDLRAQSKSTLLTLFGQIKHTALRIGKTLGLDL